MSRANYVAPLEQLLTLGRPEPWDLWVDYATMGIGNEQVPELIRLATDPALLDGAEDDVHVWGPLHAWRALGQLAAAEAIEPLLSLLPRIDLNDDDAIGEDLPVVFGRIGIVALEPLRRYVADASHPEFARVAAAEGIKHVGLTPAHRDRCAAALAELLDRPEMSDQTINAFLVIGLCALHARRHADAVERAFAAKRVDERVCGRVSEVRAELGLVPPRAARKPPDPQLLLDLAIDEVLPPSPPPPTPDWMKQFLA